MRLNRTTARALVSVAAAALLGAGAAQAGDQPPEAGGKSPTLAKPKPAATAPPAPPAPGGRIVFPVVGDARFSDDYTAPRSTGAHNAIDIVAAKRTPVAAAEAGTVKFWTTSARAGCMLYLYGRSGTTYLYIHLNNDLTTGDDNTGRCVGGVSYAKGLRNGAKVVAGQTIGYVGNSGNASGGVNHLHFEMEARNSAHLNPFPYLRRASRLLFPVVPGKPVTAALRGHVVGSDASALTMKVDQVRSWPGGLKTAAAGRRIQLSVSPSTILTDPLGTLLATARLQSLAPGSAAVAWTEKATATLKVALGQPLSLVTERIVLIR